MKVTVALFEGGSQARLAGAELPAPGSDQILVRMVATGICHTDHKAAHPGGPVPHPVVLGHEGAGVVEAVGAHVKRLAPGDHVVLTFSSCGHCPSCLEAEPAFCHGMFARNFSCGDRAPLAIEGRAVHYGFFGQSSFATHALAAARDAVAVDRSAPLELLGPLGCGIQTGAGAVLNDFRPRSGQSLAVFGAGGVGLAAIMAARLCGLTTIVAIDPNPERLRLAAELGATTCLEAGAVDLVARVLAQTGHGVDFALDTSGRPDVMRQAIDVLAPRGECGFVTGPWDGAPLPVPVRDLLAGRKLRGIHQGSSNPPVFIPRLVELHRAGLFPFDRLVRFYDFADINTALADMAAGRVVKPVLRFGRS